MVFEGHFFFYVSEGAVSTSHSNSEEFFQLHGLRSLYLVAIGWLQGKLKNVSVSARAMGTSHCKSSDWLRKQKKSKTFILRPLEVAVG